MSVDGDVAGPVGAAGIDAGMTAAGSDGEFVKRLVATATAAYGPAGRFARFFARGKLPGDPLFATLLRTGAIPDASCLVDLGCGQGLLAVWLRAAYDAWRAQPPAVPWPHDWPAPPKVGTYLGIDHSRADIARARLSMPAYARVFSGDIRTVGMTMLDRCDVVALFDVLHYLDFAAQDKLVGAMAASLPPWGVLVLRVGDRATRSLRLGDAVDLVVCACRGHPRRRLYRRSLADWCGLLESHGFTVELLDDGLAGASRKRAPAFANVLLRASRDAPASSGPTAREPLR